jgi:hypothetical protein
MIKLAPIEKSVVNAGAVNHYMTLAGIGRKIKNTNAAFDDWLYPIMERLVALGYYMKRTKNDEVMYRKVRDCL